MMLHLDNAPKRAIRFVALAGALIFSTNVWADDDTAVTAPEECEEGPTAKPDDADPSSFAAGCGANANGDGSVAIGHGAKTQREEEVDASKFTIATGESIVGDEDPVLIYEVSELDKDGNVLGITQYKRKAEDKFEDLTREESAQLLSKLREDPERSYDHDDAVRIATEENNGVVVANSKIITAEGVDVRFDDIRVPVSNAVAIGQNAVVNGDGGIALGSQATVGQDKTVDGKESAGTNGIAIGNGAKVTGNNGIAIGADVTAGENEIVIGTSDHSATIAGVKISTRNGNAIVHGVDINKARADIDTNADRITANASAIAGNAAAFADFDERLMGVDERVKQVAAMSAALSAVPNAVSGDGDFFLGVGFGNSAGQQGIAVGVSARFGAKKNIVVNAGAASAGDETSARVGVGFVW